MTEEDQEEYRNNNICRFCEKEISDKVRDHCHLTGNFRGPAHCKCDINGTQKKNDFIPFTFHNYDCHLFFKKLVDKKNDKVKFDIIPKTNEEYISVTYCCIRFIDYRLLSSSWDSLVKTLVDSSHKTLKNLEEEVVDNDEILIIFNELKMLFRRNRYNNDSIKDFRKDFPEEIIKILVIY